MKEYLFKGIDGTYKVVDHDCQGRAIEVIEGADAFAVPQRGANEYFYKNDFNMFYSGLSKKWEICGVGKNNFHDVLWRRHTQPEELPFVDDGLTDATAFIQSNMDQVNNPQHYTSGSIECIDAIESSMTKEAFAGFLKGNVQKYMWRYESKGGMESLQKAQWYLNRLILLQSAHD